MNDILYMTAKFTLDTNILVYAIDKDAGERHKKSLLLVDRAVEYDVVLTLQSLGEFFYAVTRKGKMSVKAASEQVTDWKLLFPIVAAKADTLSVAIQGVMRHKLAFWDALLWATAKEYSVTHLLSEDFHSGHEIGGIQFVSPFASDNPFDDIPSP